MTCSESLRRINAVPDAEMESRWKRIRAAMAKQEIDAVVVQSNNMWLGGYFRYITDIVGENAYPKTVVFFRNADMTIITSGTEGEGLVPASWMLRGVDERLSAPYFSIINFTNNFEGDMVLKTLKRHGCKKVGVIAPGIMSATFYNSLVANCGESIDVVDFTDEMDAIRSIKTPYEMKMAIKACQCQDEIMATVPALFRPGVNEHTIRSEIKTLLTEMGSEEQFIAMGSGPLGGPMASYESFFQNRVIEANNWGYLLVEVNGPGGYYAELGRIIAIGEPTKEMLALHNAAREIQQTVAEAMRPGLQSSELLRINNEYMRAYGYPKEGRLFAHGQGYDLVERPAGMEGETMLLDENMYLAVHPTCAKDGIIGWLCDDYIVTKDGGKRMHTTPSEIIVVDV